MAHRKITDRKYTREEAAKICGVSLRTIDRAIKNGELEAFKPGKEVQIFESDLSEWYFSKQISHKRIGRPRRKVRITRA